MIKRNFLKIKIGKPSLIIIPILLSFLISLYVLIDVDQSTDTLDIYINQQVLNLKNIYELGAFAVVIFYLYYVFFQ
ncbi:MAG: hypothetical protein CM15mP126_8250 [Gammaproteobacteria bacterium]|nr:MAG: hypothetical protein CM15mP126_8250 [Gammaproteobacteria bacterium]